MYLLLRTTVGCNRTGQGITAAQPLLAAVCSHPSMLASALEPPLPPAWQVQISNSLPLVYSSTH